ncbi:MAG: GNAT family N-acetyltransferase [Planctomycetes bacterium]|nr:GNAT family N-acetyltransferase [Planctomycetota bacterium]MCL4732159.1 GNAT family N-acetyltransferase [Planctomycetota bacterium]
MSELAIRDFEPARDWREFALLNYRTFRDSIPPDEPVNEDEFRRHHHWLLGHFAPNDPGRNKVFVAELGGRYAGHCWIGSQTDFFTRRVDPWIFDLSVKPEFRRRGIARALHARAEQYVRATGAPFLGLQLMAHNDAAAKLYERLGYRARAVSMKKKL